ncbi:hypothetical protein RclHR1_03550011 [Rhizophagus clarus]|uniref:BRO domain-containing protein 1 n=1 Tax=Rhizophagus clarus TaxID=94130 RepID=A0A2Z6RSP0_9GLOM|nr:hypothetical protein RclHR1_03550011 [Rhizophagus clarus]GES77504.1 BRO1-like domain-containing protein [Rhizophagus clarus]
MNQSPTIHVPTKRTDEVDWASPLKRYIQTTYQEDPEKYADEANSIHRLRQDMRGAGKDLTGRDLLYRYYGQLELLDLRFPVDENHIRVSFTWYDAFTHKSTSQFSLAYEKASTIFNIASVLSAIATSQNRSESEGLKRAFNFFQASAGMYTYINDNFLHAPSTDLSRDTVKLLSQLMLTQAQECFLEQSLVKNKPALIAKLAAQASWSYGNIVENMGDLINRSVFDRSWLTVCQIKQKYLGSIAQYQKSLACEGEGKYGECVCRLNIAETLAKEAHKLSNNFVSSFSPTVTQTLPPDAATSLQDLAKSNLALITEKKNSATKDNDIVYHEVVPQESVIPPIDKLNAVKQMPIQELYGSNEIQKVIGQDIFHRLIPLSVHESASLYSEEKAKIVRSETERCDISNGELEAALEYMKLPRVLGRFKTNSNNESRYLNELASPTSEVKQWAQLVKTEEEQSDTIKDLQTNLNGLKNRAKEMLDEISSTLENEQRNYDTMKAKYGDLWTQTSLTTAFRQDFLNHSSTLEKAASSDQHLLQRYNQCLNDIMILQKGENSDDLEKIFAEALALSVNINNDVLAGGRRVSNAESLLDVDTSKSEEDIGIKLNKIEECLSNLNKVRKERMDTLNDLKEKTHQDDISHLLILNKKSQNIEPQLFATELEKFSPYRNRITSSIHHQQALLQDLTANFKTLMESDEAKKLQTRWDHAEQGRRDVCDRLRKAKDGYLEVKEGLRKGIQFYVDLTEMIENLSKNLRQHAITRQQEHNNLLQSLQAQEQQRVKDQINKLISTNTPSSNQAINSYDSMAQLTEETNKLSITNTLPIDNRNLNGLSISTIPQTKSNATNFYNTPSQPYVSSAPSPIHKDSYSNVSAPYVPMAPPKPSAPPALASPSSPNNYSTGSSQRSISFSQPSSVYNMSDPTSPKSQGPPIPPLPSAYQSQQNIMYNSHQPTSLQQPPQQSPPILHQQYTRPPQLPPQQLSQQLQSQQLQQQQLQQPPPQLPSLQQLPQQPQQPQQLQQQLQQQPQQQLQQPQQQQQSQPPHNLPTPLPPQQQHHLPPQQLTPQQLPALQQLSQQPPQLQQPPPQTQASQFHTYQQHGYTPPSQQPSQQSYSRPPSTYVMQTPQTSQTPSQSMQSSYPSTNFQYSQQSSQPTTNLTSLQSTPQLQQLPNQYRQQSFDSYTNQTNQYYTSQSSSGNQYHPHQPQYSGAQTQGLNNPQAQQTAYQPHTPAHQNTYQYNIQHPQGNYQPTSSYPAYPYNQQTHQPTQQQSKSLLDD